jgi:GH24 family phage-related lysozyme (muramidase)
MARLPVDVAELSNRNELPTGAMQTQQASAANTGGLVAGALGELGGAVSGLAMKIEANKRESKGFDIEQQFIRLQEEDARAYEEQKRGLAGSGDGFWESSREASNKRYDEFISTLPPWAQDEYRTKAERKKAERSNSAFYDQYKQQDDNSRAVLGEEARKAGLGVQENPASFEEFRQQQYALIDKSTLPAAEKEQMKREVDNALAVTAAESEATNNPGAVVAGSFQPGTEGVKGLIRKKEGFRTTAYWDVDAWRTGYGSDTYTTADGVVHKVTKDSVITQEDAERDLDRRINTEFMPSAVNAIGADAWAKLSPAAQAVMTSLAYNYGAGAWDDDIASVAAAAKTGDPQVLADAVRGLAGHNGGMNAGRRNSEADLILGGKGTGGPPPAYQEYLTPDQKAATDRIAERALQDQINSSQAAADAQRGADQDTALLGIMEGPDPQGSYDNARRDGLFLSPEEVKRADTALREREKTDAEVQRGLEIMNGSVPAVRTSEEDRKAVNGAFNAALAAGADPEVAARGAFDRTGIIPPDFAKGLIGGAQSNDPTRVQGSLASAASLLGKDPNAFNGVSNSGKLVDDAFEFTRRTTQLGESAEDATKAILADRARPPLAAAAQEEALKVFRKEFLKPEAIEAGLAEAAENGWGTDGAVPVGPETGGDAMRSIYKGLAEEGFRKFNDPDRAISYAATEMGRRFGVFNGTLTQYPPEKVGLPKLPNADDPYAWVAEQAASAATEQFGQEFAPGEIVLVPVEERGVSTRGAFTGLPTPIPGKPGKSSAPYSVVVVPEDGGPVMVVPGVFLPDLDAYVADRNAAMPDDPVQTPGQAAEAERLDLLKRQAADQQNKGEVIVGTRGAGARNQDF